MRRRKGLKAGKIAIIVLSILLVVAAALLAVCYNAYSKKKAEAGSYQREMAANKKTVFVATEDIDAGEQVLKDVNVIQQTIYSGLDSAIYMKEADLGFRALVPVKAGMAVQKNMIGQTEITEDTREYEVAVVNLMTSQRDNDIVDIRIMYPEGGDYTVISKKRIKKMSLENSIFLADLTEDEILSLASATIDAYVTPGTRLYTVKYLQPTIQEATIPNYPLRTNVIDLIHNDPNILQVAQETLNANARQDLEQRLGHATDDKNAQSVASGQSTQKKSRDEEIRRLMDQGIGGAGNEGDVTASVDQAPDVIKPVEKTEAAPAETTAAPSKAQESTAAAETTAAPAETEPQTLPAYYEETTAAQAPAAPGTGVVDVNK